MREAGVHVGYLSAGANRHTAVADWGSDHGIVAFGADCNVALWRPDDPTPRGITHLLSGHKGAVKAVKFLPAPSPAPSSASSSSSPPQASGEVTSYLLSGADDQCLKLWRLVTTTAAPRGEIVGCECVQTVHAHAAAINCIAALGGRRQRDGSSSDGSRRRIIVTGAADASIKVWSLDYESGSDGDAVNGEASKTPALRLLQTIRPNPKFFPLALALSELSDGDDGGDEGALVLAAAGTRDIVQIFVAGDLGGADVGGGGEETAPGSFRLQATLSGHEGWIRSLDFAREDAASGGGHGDLILASASQDKYIRLWRFHAGTELPATAAEDDTAAAYLPGRSPSNKAHRLKVGGAGRGAGGDYSITFEALLLGHDDWIYSAKWCPPAAPRPSGQNNNDSNNNNNINKLQLLSASADNTLAVWEADPASGIWVTTARLGEISREKGATTATGSTGGFWTGLWGPQNSSSGGVSTSVACLGRTGSWRLWSKGVGDGEDEDRWVPRPGISGHTRAVTGVTWARSGGYLLSTSADQTTRLHAPVPAPEVEEEGEPKNNISRNQKKTWHEMSRPQIHGYDLNCIDSLGDTQFVSGADEKLMRVFDEPGAVARLLHRVCGVDRSNSSDPSRADASAPDAADMPVLGLSNKAVEGDDEGATTTAGDTNNGDQAVAAEGETKPARVATAAALDALSGPPPEDALARHTLWPETEKLYGHGYEVSCVAGSHGGGVIASACRASSATHAVVRLFETAPRWTEVRPPLAAHNLTATRLRFSPPADRFLLSVGRDRVWAVFEREDAGDAETEAPQYRYRLRQSNPRGHSRMILDAAWAPAPVAEEHLVFATAGRDKQVKIWQQRRAGEGEGEGGAAAAADAEIVLAATIPETHPVTAVDFLPRTVAGSSSGDQTSGGAVSTLVLAVGTEAGLLSLYSLEVGAAGVNVLSSMTLRPELCLAKAVQQLSWRPPRRNADVDADVAGDEDELAIAGEDGSLRIYSFSNLGR